MARPALLLCFLGAILTAVLVSKQQQVWSPRSASERLPQLRVPEPSEVRPSGFILLTGLDGSCSADVARGLEAAGVFVQSFNGTLDAGSRKPLLEESQKTMNYDVEKLPSALRDEVVAEVETLLERFKCSQRVCAFKSENFLSQLPVYRSVIAEQRKQRLCVIHYVEDPARWVLGAQRLAMPKYYSALLGETFDWTALGGQYNEAKIRLKSSLWSKVEQEVNSWIQLTEHEPLVRNFWWRCGVDALNEVVDAALAACGGLRGLAAGTGKGQGTWEAKRLVLPLSSPEDSSLQQRWLPTIVNITGDTAKLVGLPLPREPAGREFFQAAAVKTAAVKAAPASTEAHERKWTPPFQQDPGKRLLVYPPGKLAFCYIDKNACTQFNRLFNKLNGRKGGTWGISAIDRFGLKRENISREKGWRWAVFLRDPLLRYLSAWGSRCVQREDGGQDCLPRGMFSKFEVEGFERNVRANFRSPGALAFNQHWAPQQDFCWGLGNASGFDFVGHLEGDVHGQVQEMLRMVGAEAKVGLVRQFFPPEGKRFGHSSYKHVPPSLFYRNSTIQQMVMQMYRKDFELKGLHFTPIKPSDENLTTR